MVDVQLYSTKDFWRLPHEEERLQIQLGVYGPKAQEAGLQLQRLKDDSLLSWQILNWRIEDAAVQFEKKRLMENFEENRRGSKQVQEREVAVHMADLEANLGVELEDAGSRHSERRTAAQLRLKELCAASVLSLQALSNVEARSVTSVTQIAVLAIAAFRLAPWGRLLGNCFGLCTVVCSMLLWAIAARVACCLRALQRQRGKCVREWQQCTQDLRSATLSARLATASLRQSIVAALTKRTSMEAAVRRKLALKFDADVQRMRQESRQSVSMLDNYDPYHPYFRWHVSDQHSAGKVRNIGEIVADFKKECAAQYQNIEREFNEEQRLKMEAGKANFRAVKLSLERERSWKAAALEQTLCSHARVVKVGLQAALPLPREGHTPIGVAWERITSWLGCPGACYLVAVSPALCLEVLHLKDHSSMCPASRRCEVCGYQVLPSPSQRERLVSHRNTCAPWLVDGKLYRRYLVPPLPAGIAKAGVRAALCAVEEADAPGVDRSPLAKNAMVCCPHFGCLESFPGKEAAVEHARNCSNAMRPSFCTKELAQRIAALRVMQ